MTEKKRATTSFGQIAYLETGADGKPPVLFVHGIPTSSYLWRDVLRFLQNDFHCYAPDLMGLGDTEVDPDTTAFHMEAQAEMLAELMSTLGHERFAVVCHDQGGAAAQILMSRVPERLTAVVLTDCVAYDNWPVPAVARLQAFSRIPVLSDLMVRSGLVEWLQVRTRLSDFRRGVVDPKHMSEQSIREYLRPLRESEAHRKRFMQFVQAGHPRYTELAVEGLRRFDRPVMIVWAADDFYISPSWGKKLYEDIPGAERFELVPFCGHFWQEERPAEFSSHIGDFLSEVLRRPTGVGKSPARGQPKARKLPVMQPPGSGKA